MLNTELTKFSGEIYADPSRKLYHILGMTTESLETTPKRQQRKSYLPNYAVNVAQIISVSDTSALSLCGSHLLQRALNRPISIGKRSNWEENSFLV